MMKLEMLGETQSWFLPEGNWFCFGILKEKIFDKRNRGEILLPVVKK